MGYLSGQNEARPKTGPVATQFPVNVAKMEGAKFTSFAKLNKKVKSTTISVICFYNSCRPIVTVLTRYFTMNMNVNVFAIGIRNWHAAAYRPM